VDTVELAERICQGTNLKPKNLEVLDSDGVSALVQHKGRNCFKARSQVELINLKSKATQIVWTGIKLGNVKKAKLCKQYLKMECTT